jgi:vacuolar-type H+-ATPase subunit I/STV1
MTNSTLIARLMGPVLLIMGIGTALGLLGVGMAAGDYTSVMREMANPALSILVGILTLLAGLAIVNAHNLWVSDWRVIITILGWLAIIRGVLSLLFPARMQTIGETIIATTSGPIIAALIIFVLGGILSWMGYRDVWTVQAAHKQAGKR